MARRFKIRAGDYSFINRWKRKTRWGLDQKTRGLMEAWGARLRKDGSHPDDDLFFEGVELDSGKSREVLTATLGEMIKSKGAYK